MWSEICDVYSPKAEEKREIKNFCKEIGITIEQYLKVLERVNKIFQ